MNVDWYLSARLARKIRAKPRDCYRNAQAALCHAPRGTVFVVGQAYSDGVAVPHAWLETRDGRILDPTTVATKRRLAEMGFNAPDFERYEAGRRYTHQEINREVSLGHESWLNAIAA